MTSRTIPAAILSLVALAAVSCSKTQDTSPDRRVFGDPPKILSVEPIPPVITKHVECDFTEIMRKYFCQFGINDIDFQPGGGWMPNDSIPDSDKPGVFIEGYYDEINLRVKVTDPNSPPPPGQSNILLVSASFPDPREQVKEETSLVLFDDGSITQFKFPQKVTRVGEDCIVDGSGSCQCYQAKLAVTSGDDLAGAGDGLYARRLGLVDKKSVNDQGTQFLQDCIVLTSGATPILAEAGWVYDFRIEAVDRQGNLATWPTRLRATIGPSSFACNGDACSCCWMQSNNQAADCHGLPGTISPGYPDGLCIDLLGP